MILRPEGRMYFTRIEINTSSILSIEEIYA
jgi:hypothetical protein